MKIDDTQPLIPTNSHLSMSFVVPCMGRLEYLKLTVPTVISQENSQYVLVDYSCPQRCSKWIAAEFPEATRVNHTGECYFSLAKARNIGFTACKSEWICFLDADIKLESNFMSRVLPLLTKGNYVVALPTMLDRKWWSKLDKKYWHLSGFLICHRDDFDFIGGYDTRIEGYGDEDVDIRLSLQRTLKRREVLFDYKNCVEHISHSNELRTQYYKEKDRKKSMKQNRAYVLKKWITR